MREQPDPQLAFLRALEQTTIAGDVVEVASDTWAIHGSIPVDGDVLLAEYATQDQARRVLGQLPVDGDATAAHPRPGTDGLR